MGGREASPFWGGSKNPDGSKKKIARYNTKEEKTSRQKQNGKLRTQRKDEVRKRFLQRRVEAETNGQWSGPRKFEEWLLGVAEQVLDGDSIEDTTQVRTASLRGWFKARFARSAKMRCFLYWHKHGGFVESKCRLLNLQ